MSETNIGQSIYNFANKIYPIPRSITGDGVRETLRCIDEEIKDTGYSLNIIEVKSGTEVFDWTVPKEWVIQDAYIEDEEGNKLIDYQKHNLHVLGYSLPVDKWVTVDELMEHIYTEEGEPDAIPYVTSYYKERFGFCMSENQKQDILSKSKGGTTQEPKYHMYVDSKLKDGSLTLGELIIPSTEGNEEEIFISTYTCHPMLANNECSGPSLATYLIKHVAGMKKRRYNYRFLFNPETIGAITYLSLKLDELKKNVIAGFVLSCVGDDRDYSFIESRYGDTLADRVIENVYKYRGKYTHYDFSKRGSDERQYCSPGVDLPVVGVCRSKYGCYPEYHTSLDNMTLVSPEGFEGSYEVMCEVINILEHNGKYQVRVLCEPQLGKRNMYPSISKKGIYDEVLVMRDLIAYSDGRNDLIDISDRIKVPVRELIPILERLLENEIVS